ncbi:hypothetical protein GCM10009813_14680 [Brevibacterium marinum]
MVGSPGELHEADDVVDVSGFDDGENVLVDGAIPRTVGLVEIPAAAYLADEVVHAIYLFRFTQDRVSSVEVIADEEILARLNITL